MGDVLFTFPSMARLIERAKEEGQTPWVMWTNKSMESIFPDFGQNRLTYLPVTADYTKVSVHELVLRGGHRPGSKWGHPCSHIYWHFVGEPPPNEYMVPQISYPVLDVPEYDFVIHPFAMADLARMWPLHRWQEVINWLKEQYPGCTIAMVGTTSHGPMEDLMKINPYAAHVFTESERIHKQSRWEGVDYFYDRSVPELCNLLAKIKKCFISVDSGPGRLMQSIGRPHVLIAHNSVGMEHCSYPGVYLLYGALPYITVEQVTSAIKKALI